MPGLAIFGRSLFDVALSNLVPSIMKNPRRVVEVAGDAFTWACEEDDRPLTYYKGWEGRHIFRPMSQWEPSEREDSERRIEEERSRKKGRRDWSA